MFLNREEAGKQLGFALQKYKGEDPVILGIPRGGVVTGYYVAKALEGKLNVGIARKLGHPLNPELAIGAVAEDKSLYLTPYSSDNISQEMLDNLIDQKFHEIKQRRKNFRKNKPLELKGKTVILVDDGIATGATLFALIRMCENQQANKIIVAAPVGSSRIKEKLREEVDEVFILETPANYHAVSQVYMDFHEVTDKDVMDLLHRREMELSSG